jgi:tRNA 2-thiouridine synthesizing protein A
MSEVAMQLDARGLMCPIPVLRAKKAVSALGSGEVLELLSSDPGSSRDLDAFCQQTGNEYLSCDERDGVFVIHIRKG